MTMNSTISELVQDNSLPECVSPETNPMDTVQSNELIFGQKHNDLDCALCPTAKRACDRAWVTAKNLEEWSGMSTMTLNRRLHDLEECERIQSLSDLIKIKIEDTNGRGHETTLYNLNAYGIRLSPKWACDILDKMYDEDDTFLREYRTV